MGIFATPDQLPRAPEGGADWLKHVAGRSFVFHDGRRLDPPDGAEVRFQPAMAGLQDGQRPHGGQYAVTLGGRQVFVPLGGTFAEAESLLAKLTPAPVAGLKEIAAAAAETEMQS